MGFSRIAQTADSSLFLILRVWSALPSQFLTSGLTSLTVFHARTEARVNNNDVIEQTVKLSHFGHFDQMPSEKWADQATVAQSATDTTKTTTADTFTRAVRYMHFSVDTKLGDPEIPS
jgi:hypothetical protein